ncbi:hypothetical protein [Serratia aquatilis]|uniref:Uncharacterized protein n=1 Tax=Serratia aquatilis TaxID=1737515 RepID=A0ABV6EL02_9GAMM
MSRASSTSTIYLWPHYADLSRLTETLRLPALSSHIDADQIGFVGFSAGGATGLILAECAFSLSRSMPDLCDAVADSNGGSRVLIGPLCHLQPVT